jgi:sporulation protein YqfC
MAQKRKDRSKKQNKQEHKVDIRAKMTELLELPKEIVLDIPKITMYGSKNMVIENYKGIIEYDNNVIRVNTSMGIIKIAGERLIIKEITSEDLMVNGGIISLEFLR